MCTSLNSAQTNTSSMHRIVLNTRLLIISDWTMWTKKDNASIMAIISVVLLECGAGRQGSAAQDTLSGTRGRRQEWWRSWEETEVTHVLFRFWLLQFPCQQLSETRSWECFVKNDSVRSCLIELQSFLQRKVDVDPIHRFLMFLPCFKHVLCTTRCSQVDRVRILVFCVRRIHKQNEYCLSVAQILTTRYQSWIDDGM